MDNKNQIEKFSEGFLFNEIKYIKHNDFIKISYKNKGLDVETPLLRVPFGIKNIGNRYLLQMSIDNIENNKENSNFLTFINMLEAHLKENLYIEFKNKTFISKVYNNVKYSPLICLDLKQNTKILNENSEHLQNNDYLDKCFFATINFSYNGVWFNENSYGVSFKNNKINIKTLKRESIKINF